MKLLHAGSQRMTLVRNLLNCTLVTKTKTQDYIICLGLPHHSNDSKDEDKQYNKPFKDRQLDHIWGFTQIMILAPCLEEKNSDMVHLGYCNVVGISAKVVSNSKVNAIRK
jgi:hypothetical protein